MVPAIHEKLKNPGYEVGIKSLKELKPAARVLSFLGLSALYSGGAYLGLDQFFKSFKN